MAKTLRVINSFFVMEIGDEFCLSEDGKQYVSKYSEEYHKAGDDNEINSTYNSQFTISLDYAKQLIEQGYLEEVEDEAKMKTQKFVNVFDEIDNLIAKYTKELKNIDENMANEPQCVKVEKTTVLTNILSILNYLKSLRK